MVSLNWSIVKKQVRNEDDSHVGREGVQGFVEVVHLDNDT